VAVDDALLLATVNTNLIGSILMTFGADRASCLRSCSGPKEGRVVA